VQYFPEDIISLTPKEIFIDGGAYNGDTIELLLEKCSSTFGQIVAFEPDSGNYEQLGSYISGLPEEIGNKILYKNSALGITKGKICFDAAGTLGSCVDPAGSTEVDCVALDEELGSIEPTFIKLDVEGSELDALSGATRIIQTKAPVLAVCAYHRPADLWRIPLHIANINPEYRFYLRQHKEDGFESVVYAAPPWRERLKM
jgi:FkbM family methyltransferase